MSTSYTTAIEQLYVAYFNRPADAAGLAYWSKALQAQKGDTSVVSSAFARSTEYIDSFAGMSPSQVVGKIYQNLFGRAAEASGLNYWAGLLGTRELTIDRIVKDMADAAQGTDKIVFDNKVAAATAFTAALDSDSAIDAFAHPQVAQAAKEFIASIQGDASLAQALAPATLAASMLKMLHGGAPLPLTQGTDRLDGSSHNDTFSAPMLGGAATLQSGDELYGGQGTRDMLFAELGNGNKEAVKPALQVEVVRVSALAGPGTAGGGVVRLDASLSSGVREWESHSSQAGLIIDNASRAPKTTLREHTVTMRDTSAGDVDFGVYFTPAALSDTGVQGGALRLQLMNLGGDPAALADTPYNGVMFRFNGELQHVSSAAIASARTYGELVDAVRAAVHTVPALQHLRVEQGAPFTATGSNGNALRGYDVLITSARGSDTFSMDAASGYTASEPVAPNSMHSRLFDHDTKGTGHVEASIVLDRVGRGGTGGDLVVGSTAEGGFTAGVERFFIEVRDSSALQTINSTNNALHGVTIVNGLTTEHGNGPANQGKLTVVGATAPAVAGSAAEALPRSADQHNGFGFSDVRVIDASAMSGAIAFDAEITKAALLKYSVAAPQYQQHFFYRGGAGNDSMHVTIDGAVLASATEGLSGRQPGNYVLTVDGGAGNDDIGLTITDGLANWAEMQKWNHNVILRAGAGDDTVRLSSAGASTIWLGTGKDTVVLEAGWKGRTHVAEFAVDGDRIDLTALGGRGDAFKGAAVASVDRSITVQAESGANDALAEIAAMYADKAAASHQVFVAYDANNVGKVYAVVDTVGGAIEVTQVGSIALDGAGWGALGAANFA